MREWIRIYKDKLYFIGTLILTLLTLCSYRFFKSTILTLLLMLIVTVVYFCNIKETHFNLVSFTISLFLIVFVGNIPNAFNLSFQVFPAYIVYVLEQIYLLLLLLNLLAYFTDLVRQFLSAMRYQIEVDIEDLPDDVVEKINQNIADKKVTLSDLSIMEHKNYYEVFYSETKRPVKIHKTKEQKKFEAKNEKFKKLMEKEGEGKAPAAENVSIFLSKEHESNFKKLVAKAKLQPGDIQRKAMLFIISGSEELFINVDKIYSFKEKLIYPNCVNEVPFSSSGNVLLDAAFGFFNESYSKLTIQKAFGSLNKNEQKLLINGIKLRFNHFSSSDVD